LRRSERRLECAEGRGIFGEGHFCEMEASAGMIVNLNQYRKKRRRAEAEAEAEAKENRARFGRTKEERAAELGERERARKEIENKRLD
jgi:hypothetical protein